MQTKVMRPTFGNISIQTNTRLSIISIFIIDAIRIERKIKIVSVIKKTRFLMG